MPEWLISLISVIVGAAIGIGGTELIKWWKRPKFEMDFEEREGQKPYIPDFNDETISVVGYTHRIKYLRLKVRNKGKKPAMNCEAKLEITKVTINNEIERNITSTKVALHWSRNDPLLYSKYQDGVVLSVDQEKVFAPISFNINDEETVDVLRLPYSFSTKPDTNHSPNLYPFMDSVSLRQLRLQPNWSYQCKVTVYASNTNPKSFKFKVNWDGKVEGFNKAFTKD